jgi:hypothetical protein
MRDVIENIDPRTKSANLHYLTSRIENIKWHLKGLGLRFDENARAWGVYAYYKPYILIDDEENIQLAHSLLEMYGTKKVIKFLGLKSLEDES